MSDWTPLAEIVGALVGAAGAAARTQHESHRWIWAEIRRTWRHAQAAHDALRTHVQAPADRAHGQGGER